jgi:tetratricopeptide (TPR) repeat protein
MLRLPGVTLVCIDTANHALALRALARSGEQVRFARSLFLTDAVPPGVDVPAGIEVVPIAPIANRDAYSWFVLKDLVFHVATGHALLVQWDGYVVNADAWAPAFLDCDYVGAKWFWYDDDMRVGNGGFSLRSRRLLQALADPRIELVEAEDVTICRSFRGLLEREHCIRFADEALADRFAFEADYPVGSPFGFHGLFNFWRVMKPTEIAALVEQFSDAIARSPQLDQLLHNCLLNGMWLPAAAIARRIVAARGGAADVPALLADAEAQGARLSNVGRGDACPCGSGKRFGDCHGAPGAPSLFDLPPKRRTPDEFVAKGVDAHRAGQLAAADREYRAALALAPAHPVALHNLGLVELQRGRRTHAVEVLERAVAADPRETEFRHSLGQALAAAGRLDDAIARFREVLARRPDHAIAWYNLGLAFAVRAERAEAEAAFRQALRIAPAFAQAQQELAAILDREAPRPSGARR